MLQTHVTVILKSAILIAFGLTSTAQGQAYLKMDGPESPLLPRDLTEDVDLLLQSSAKPRRDSVAACSFRKKEPRFLAEVVWEISLCTGRVPVLLGTGNEKIIFQTKESESEKVLEDFRKKLREKGYSHSLEEEGNVLIIGAPPFK